jgi:hypothetical protein
MVGDPTPTQCVDEISGRNCKCLTVTNTCNFDITMKFTVTGGIGRGSTGIAPGETSKIDACTTRRGQTIEYGGWEKR